MKTRAMIKKMHIAFDILIWIFPYHLLISMGMISAIQQSNILHFVIVPVLETLCHQFLTRVLHSVFTGGASRCYYYFLSSRNFEVPIEKEKRNTILGPILNLAVPTQRGWDGKRPVDLWRQ
jgi:hypothetical protein